MIGVHAVGDGLTLVLLHGFTHGAAIWEPVAESLSGEYRTIAVDLRGHGRTALSAGLPTADAVADDVAQVLDELAPSHAAAGNPPPAMAGNPPPAVAGSLPRTAAAKPPPVAIWGYSMGARLALHTALRHPGRFGALILESVNPGIDDPAERAQRAAADAALAREIETLPPAEFIDRWERLPLFAGQPPEVVARLRAVRERNTPQALAAALRGLGPASMPSLWPRLQELTIPTLVITGERDHKYRAIAERVTAATPTARHSTIPGVGHAASIERPATLAEVARSFMAGVGLSGGSVG